MAIFGELYQHLGEHEKPRMALQLQYRKPQAIKTLEPEFHEKKQNYLRKQVAKEKRGAMRELRKDTQFIARVTAQKKTEKDVAYKKRIQQIQGMIGYE